MRVHAANNGLFQPGPGTVKIRVKTGGQADYPYASIRAVAEGVELEVPPHPAPCSPHPAACSLHPAPCTLRPEP